MKYIILIAIWISCNCYVTGQDAPANAETLSDTITVQLTPLQAQKIADLDKEVEDLKHRFNQALKEVSMRLSEHLMFIADANGIDPKGAQIWESTKDRIVFIVPKKEGE